MSTAETGRACVMLTEALSILDGEGEQLAALHVCQALEVLNRPPPPRG